MYHDPEINALSNVYETLKGLKKEQIGRIVAWVSSKFELDKPSALRVLKQDVEPSPPPETLKAVEEAPAAQPIMVRGLEGFMKYDSLKELFNAASVKKVGQKILLVASYLQEKENFKEVSSYDISSRLKNIGKKINNASVAINALMDKKPPLLLQTGTHGTSAKSRRKFRVTEQGLKTARSYIIE